MTRDIRKNLKYPVNRAVLPALIHFAVRMLFATMRITVLGAEAARPFHERGEGVIIVLWHSRLLMSPFAYMGKELHVLLSSHGDGDLIANTMKGFGFGLIRGSSTKGGTEALREMVRLARGNADLAITPDGPRGPAEVAKPGIAHVARMTGHVILPLAFASSRAKRFKSWDRFLLPYPFSRGVYVWGEPLFCREGETTEAFRQRIEQALREATRRADEYFRR